MRKGRRIHVYVWTINHEFFFCVLKESFQGIRIFFGIDLPKTILRLYLSCQWIFSFCCSFKDRIRKYIFNAKERNFYFSHYLFTNFRFEELFCEFYVAFLCINSSAWIIIWIGFILNCRFFIQKAVSNIVL